jgi:hypothetical protein
VFISTIIGGRLCKRIGERKSIKTDLVAIHPAASVLLSCVPSIASRISSKAFSSIFKTMQQPPSPSQSEAQSAGKAVLKAGYICFLVAVISIISQPVLLAFIHGPLMAVCVVLAIFYCDPSSLSTTSLNHTWLGSFGSTKNWRRSGL